MHQIDWIVLTIYLLGTVSVGVFLGKLVKNSSDMFAAGGQSPWWMSGLSAFMTMFSANTFVVWGGIAYEQGIVAVVINLCYGIAALLAGYTVAGKWKAMGVSTPAEYIDLRFGRGALHFYTWFMMVFRIVGTGGALYAIARLILAVLIGEDHPANTALSSPQLNIAIIVFSLIVVAYTMIGGLWAVLMTDTLQFIVLNIAVIFVIPLSLIEAGGFTGFLDAAPAGFLNATSEKYSLLFLMGWVAIHYFMIGAEWAFVQRYLCVPTPKDARKSSYLFGGLYLLSPFLWLLPPLLWRIQQPIPEGASAETVTRLSETAYILSCKAVLPVGMLGLMIAALFSATASMISSQLNVFSGVLTKNIYEPLAKNPTEKQLVNMGRLFTLILGLLIALIAIATPYFGGAAQLIISVTQIMVTPLLAPTLLAIFYRNLGVNAIWITVGLCFPLGILAKFTDVGSGTFIADSTFIGVILPLLIIAVILMVQRKESPGWEKVNDLKQTKTSLTQEQQPSSLPAKIVAVSLAVCAITLLILIPFNSENQIMLMGFGFTLISLSIGLFFFSQKKAKQISDNTK